MASDIVRSSVWEDCDMTCMARVTRNGVNITIATISAIARKVFDLDSATPTTAVATGAVTVATSVFDTLQTDGRWTKDATGYNFRDTVAGAVFASGHRYRIEYVFTGSGAEVFALVCEVTARELYSS